MIKIDLTVPQKHHYDLYVGETETIQLDYTNLVGRQGTTVSSVNWDITGPLTTANEALASNVASADLVASSAGSESGVITATYANSDVDVTIIKFRVFDPDAC